MPRFILTDRGVRINYLAKLLESVKLPGGTYIKSLAFQIAQRAINYKAMD